MEHPWLKKVKTWAVLDTLTAALEHADVLTVREGRLFKVAVPRSTSCYTYLVVDQAEEDAAHQEWIRSTEDVPHTAPKRRASVIRDERGPHIGPAKPGLAAVIATVEELREGGSGGKEDGRAEREEDDHDWAAVAEA